jgi:hypothetical protein
MTTWYSLPMIVGVVLVVIILGTALLVLWQMFIGKIDLTHLISDTDSSGETKASLSRFQFLLFTFVVAGIFLLLCIETGTFVDIPESVLGLIGISGGSYVLAKGIGSNAETRKVEAETGAEVQKAQAEADVQIAQAQGAAAQNAPAAAAPAAPAPPAARVRRARRAPPKA